MAVVTTVIPVYNGERFLEATLRSVARQTRRPDRLVVIDDGSTDATRDIVTRFDPLPCELLRNERNLGLFPNLNRALALADQTDYFHLLLADDRIKPAFLARTEQALRQVTAPSFAYSSIDWIDENGAITQAGPCTPAQSRDISARTFLARQSALQTVSVGSVLIKTSARRLPCRFREDLPQVADCVFFAELALTSRRIKSVDQALCQIRAHPFNQTGKNIKSLQAWVLDEWRAIETIASRIPESPVRRWIRFHKLKCLFAARSAVKQQWMREGHPDYAQAIEDAVRRKVNPAHLFLGRTAVFTRDLLVGPNRPPFYHDSVSP